MPTPGVFVITAQRMRDFNGCRTDIWVIGHVTDPGHFTSDLIGKIIARQHTGEYAVLITPQNDKKNTICANVSDRDHTYTYWFTLVLAEEIKP